VRKEKARVEKESGGGESIGKKRNKKDATGTKRVTRREEDLEEERRGGNHSIKRWERGVESCV